MNTLQSYVQEKQTALFEKCNVIFAFSTKQFEESKKEDVTYVRLPHGMLCDKTKVDELIKGLETIHKEGRAQDIKENGIENIIRRELINYECYYVCDWTEAYEALKNYGVTRQQVAEVFKKQQPHYD